MASKEESLKLRILGLLKTGQAPKDIAREEGIAYPKVLKWNRELQGIDSSEELQTILSVKPTVIHELAEGIKGKLEDLAEGSSELVSDVVKQINKLATLEESMQDSGIKLVERINIMVDDCTSPVELESLVNSLAKLQTAFFAKGANVQVLNAPGATFSDSGISTFKTMQRSS